jgi:hypothetical protein
MPKNRKTSVQSFKNSVKINNNENPEHRSSSPQLKHGLETFNNCSICHEDVSDRDDNILCYFCGHWVHYDCAEITPDLYRAMLQSSGSGCTYWCCKSCRSPDMPRRLRSLQSLQERQDNLELAFENLSQKVDTLPALIEEKLSSTRASLKEEIVTEILEVKRRENNLVISGLRSDPSISDEMIVIQLLKAIKAPGDIQLAACKRIGRQVNDKPALLLVSLRDQNQVRASLGSARNLRSLSQYTGVFISPDRTKNEQEQHKKLRADLRIRRERGENVMIRGNKIVPRSAAASSLVVALPSSSSTDLASVVALPPALSSDSSLRVSVGSASVVASLPSSTDVPLRISAPLFIPAPMPLLNGNNSDA